MNKFAITVILLVGIFVVAVSQSVFTVNETERAIVLQLGDPVRSISEPGLHFKLPFIQNVAFLERRILSYDATRASAYTSDNKNIVLDNFTRWRIKDAPGAALEFFKTLRTVSRAQAALGDIINAEMHVVIGRYTLTEIITTKRQEIMLKVIEEANKKSGKYGIEVVDVRIKRADLPDANQVAVFERMRAERVRLAIQYRSEGREEEQVIRSTADLERTRLLAEARNRAQVIMGEGDAATVRIFAEGLSKAPDFYEFLRSLEAYKKALKENTRLVLPLNSEFLKHFN